MTAIFNALIVCVVQHTLHIQALNYFLSSIVISTTKTLYDHVYHSHEVYQFSHLQGGQSILENIYSYTASHT